VPGETLPFFSKITPPQTTNVVVKVVTQGVSPQMIRTPSDPVFLIPWGRITSERAAMPFFCLPHEDLKSSQVVTGILVPHFLRPPLYILCSELPPASLNSSFLPPRLYRESNFHKRILTVSRPPSPTIQPPSLRFDLGDAFPIPFDRCRRFVPSSLFRTEAVDVLRTFLSPLKLPPHLAPKTIVTSRHFCASTTPHNVHGVPLVDFFAPF